jgi:hypothetical protein
MPNKETLKLLHEAQKAIFKAERAIAKEENQRVNEPMYKMRIDLAEVIRVYTANQPVCTHVLLRDLVRKN